MICRYCGKESDTVNYGYCLGCRRKMLKERDLKEKTMKSADKWVKRWNIPKSTGEGFWTVAVTADGEWGCSCPQWKFKRIECKHIHQVRSDEMIPSTPVKMSSSVKTIAEALKPKVAGKYICDFCEKTAIAYVPFGVPSRTYLICDRHRNDIRIYGVGSDFEFYEKELKSGTREVPQFVADMREKGAELREKTIIDSRRESFSEAKSEKLDPTKIQSTLSDVDAKLAEILGRMSK